METEIEKKINEMLGKKLVLNMKRHVGFQKKRLLLF